VHKDVVIYERKDLKDHQDHEDHLVLVKEVGLDHLDKVLLDQQEEDVEDQLANLDQQEDQQDQLVLNHLLLIILLKKINI
jgi:hypothetical protein